MIVEQKSFNKLARELWKKFVAQAIAEVVKLIAKLIALAILQALTGVGSLDKKKAQDIADFLGAGTITGKQHGGTLRKGQLALVGEQGPELLSTDGPAKIISNREMRGRGPSGLVETGGGDFGFAGGGNAVNLTINVSSIFGSRGERLAIAEELSSSMIELGLIGGVA
jgi:hypothetical protein